MFGLGHKNKHLLDEVERVINNFNKGEYQKNRVLESKIGQQQERIEVNVSTPGQGMQLQLKFPRTRLKLHCSHDRMEITLDHTREGKRFMAAANRNKVRLNKHEIALDTITGEHVSITFK